LHKEQAEKTQFQPNWKQKRSVEEPVDYIQSELQQNSVFIHSAFMFAEWLDRSVSDSYKMRVPCKTDEIAALFQPCIRARPIRVPIVR
jgi:hypothetical protein